MPLYGICGLDLNSTTGYALERHGLKPLLGSRHFPRFSAQNDGPQGLDFMRWVSDFLIANRPERVVAERPHPPIRQSSTRVGTITMGFAYVLQIVCAEQHIPCTFVVASTARLFFTGSGKNDKKAKGRVMQECERRGWEFPDDNASDAGCILAWAISAYHPDDALRRATVGNPARLI